jgi:tRNA nucleotidyltransferase (CCA-adding enzyme)
VPGSLQPLMRIYLVGGAVRDRLLGLEVKDRDWVVVGATPNEMLDRGFKPVGRDFPVFLHPDTGEEYALARTERKSGKGYTGFQFHTSPDVTLEEDLRRRDLTINAIAEAEDGTLHDPWQGQDDLDARILRHVSPAFSEDPLRVLRVARFYARFADLGFQVADETLTLMRELSAGDELAHLTPERVWQETERALATSSPAHYFALLRKAGALDRLFPLLEGLDTDRLAQRLSDVTDSKERPAQALALLLYQATESLTPEQACSAIGDFCSQQRVPNRMRDLALKLRTGADGLSRFDQLDGCARIQLLKQLDLIRRPAHLSTLLQMASRIHAIPARREAALQRLLMQLSEVDTRTLIEQGFSGKALGEALARQQAEICAQYKE